MVSWEWDRCRPNHGREHCVLFPSLTAYFLPGTALLLPAVSVISHHTHHKAIILKTWHGGGSDSMSSHSMSHAHKAFAPSSGCTALAPTSQVDQNIKARACAEYLYTYLCVCLLTATYTQIFSELILDNAYNLNTLFINTARIYLSHIIKGQGILLRQVGISTSQIIYYSVMREEGRNLEGKHKTRYWKRLLQITLGWIGHALSCIFMTMKEQIIFISAYSSQGLIPFPNYTPHKRLNS